MRTTLFLSTLFAVTLVGGAALAENPHESSPTKAPRVVERLRSKGDIVDKSYRTADKGPQASSQASAAGSQAGQQKAHFDKTNTRINCSDSGVDCHAPKGAAQANGLVASAGQTGRAAQSPPFLDKILGKDRTQFNEADQDEGMNSRAVKRVWAAAAGNNAGAGAATGVVPLAQQKQNVRTQEQASSARMSCNEADECSMPIKEVKKVWAYDAIKKGVWNGPEAAKPSAADVAVARMKAEQAKKN